MSKLRHQHRISIIPTLILTALASCDFDEPPAKDPSEIYGCYTAPDAPSFSLSSAGMRPEGSQVAVPFRYEFRKVGYVVNVRLVADEAEGRLAFSPGENHFYRVMPSDAGTIIVVAFGPAGTIKSYRRELGSNCMF